VSPNWVSANSFTNAGLLITCTADYCASKAAIIALHESLRYELDKRHGTSGSINPVRAVDAFCQVQSPESTHLPGFAWTCVYKSIWPSLLRREPYDSLSCATAINTLCRQVHHSCDGQPTFDDDQDAVLCLLDASSPNAAFVSPRFLSMGAS
jgi:hypothetical protein